MKAYRMRRLIIVIMLDDKRRHSVNDLVRKLRKRYSAHAYEGDVSCCIRRLLKDGFIRFTGCTESGDHTWKTI